MAKTSAIQKNLRRRKLVARYRAKRSSLKSLVMDKSKQFEERFGATMKLAKIPRNSSRTRVRNRCMVTGRSRGNYAQFSLSRIIFREMASNGLIPGVTKASW